MRQRERSDDLHDGEEGPADQQEAQEEQDVIIAGEDVQNAQLQELDEIAGEIGLHTLVDDAFLEDELFHLSIARDRRERLVVRSQVRQRLAADGEVGQGVPRPEQKSALEKCLAIGSAADVKGPWL